MAEVNETENKEKQYKKINKPRVGFLKRLNKLVSLH